MCIQNRFFKNLEKFFCSFLFFQHILQVIGIMKLSGKKAIIDRDLVSLLYRPRQYYVGVHKNYVLVNIFHMNVEFSDSQVLLYVLSIIICTGWLKRNLHPLLNFLLL